MNKPVLSLHQCEVTAAQGRETRRGVAFSGLLWIRGVPVAEFRNAGEGGCNVYRVRPATIANVYWDEFQNFAKHVAPVEFEHTDHTVGVLWDWAMMRPARFDVWHTLHVWPLEQERDAAAQMPAPNEWTNSSKPEWLQELSAYVTLNGTKRRGTSKSDAARHAASRKSRKQRPE